MNFLAHAQLSQNKNDVIFGNFIADSIKGKSYLKYKNEIITGILLHRNIDDFTDKHVLVRDSKRIVRNEFGKYSGVAVDIYFDHFLARNWNNYHDMELVRFSKKVYTILAKKYLILPPRVKRMLPFLIAQNWLVGYANFSDLNRVFYGMDRRTDFVSGMSSAVNVLKDNYDALENNFNNFYGELMEYSKKRYEFLEQNDNFINLRST